MDKKLLNCFILPKKLKLFKKMSLFIFEWLKIQVLWIQDLGFDLMSMLQVNDLINIWLIGW